MALSTLLETASRDMRARAAVAPLVLGAKGSESDLVFGALFFATRAPDNLAMRDLARVETRDADRDPTETRTRGPLAFAVPIALGATARKTPVVGTTLDYFDRRALAPAEGQFFATISDCVVGAGAARALGLAPGDKLFTDPESLSNLAGVFPLELRVTGVLPATGTPDDGVIFVDLPTMWTIRGLGHRHDDPTQATTPGALMAKDGANAIASEALKIERSATEAPAPDFHFHGSIDAFPIDAALVFPRDAKAQAILLGRFTGKDEALQLVRPDLFVERVLDRIFGVGRVLGAVALATTALVALVVATAFALSIRLRADELALMKRLGASRARVAAFLAVEAMMLLSAAVAVAAVVAATAPLFADAVLRAASGV
ncbi:MAG: ABC transporter permease [Planctomycetaceae bacterium]|nr:ABC transporter permease [Planctomycetaceae bacterium]